MNRRYHKIVLCCCGYGGTAKLIEALERCATRLRAADPEDVLKVELGDFEVQRIAHLDGYYLNIKDEPEEKP